MAMRITTKMMQNTAIRNLNVGKKREQKVMEQMSTGKLISRPSDDPIIAIRSLKLNSSLDKITQYYQRNASDAESWLDLTDSAITNVVDILSGEKGLGYLITQAAAQYNTTDDRKTLLQDMMNKVKEIYAAGNADSAGKSIFTGYRTDLPLTFTKEDVAGKGPGMYRITEQVTNEAMDSITFIKKGDLPDLNEGSFLLKDTAGNYVSKTTEYDVESYEIPRIRLAYDDVDEVKPRLGANGDAIKASYIDKDGKPRTPTDEDGNDIVLYDPEITLSFGGQTYSVNPEYDVNGKPINKIKCFDTAVEDAYMYALNHEDEVVYIAETGEMLLGKNVKEKMAQLSPTDEVRMKYEKSEWKEGDLNPVHYFYAEYPRENKETLIYNAQYIDGDKLVPDDRQIIEYDIGNNQRIRVNTTPDELFTHDMGRAVNELISSIEEYYSVSDNLDTISKMIESGEYAGDDLDKLNSQKAALEKALNLIKDKIQDGKEDAITLCDNWVERANLAATNCGARGARLEVIKSRLEVQQTNFEELVSKNEDADYDELTVQLESIKLTYNAALSSIAFVMQNSLLDYIR